MATLSRRLQVSMNTLFPFIEIKTIAIYGTENRQMHPPPKEPFKLYQVIWVRRLKRGQESQAANSNAAVTAKKTPRAKLAGA